MTRRDRERLWYQAFDLAIEKYSELKLSSGHSPAFNYASIGQSGQQNYNPRVVQASPSDYICEIELAAEEALSDKDDVLWVHFEHYYVKGHDLPPKPSELTQKLDFQVKIKVGRIIYNRRLHHIKTYFRPVDTR